MRTKLADAAKIPRRTIATGTKWKAMRLLMLLVALVAILLLTTKSLYAQGDVESQARACGSGNVNPKERIASCSYLLRSVPLTDQQRVSIRAGLGLAYLQNGDLDQALRQFGAAKYDMAAKDPAVLAQINAGIGEAFRQQGKAEQARNSFTEALRLDPNNGLANQGIAALGPEPSRSARRGPSEARTSQASPDAEDAYALFGKHLDDPAVKAFTGSDCSMAGPMVHLSCPSLGTDLVWDPNHIIRQVSTYPNTGGSYKSYEGPLPFGLTKEDTRTVVQSKLGPPDQSTQNVDNYKSRSPRISVTYIRSGPLAGLIGELSVFMPP